MYIHIYIYVNMLLENSVGEMYKLKASFKDANLGYDPETPADWIEKF